MKNIFYNNLNNFLEDSKNEYLQNLLKNNIDYKNLYDNLYSKIDIISKKLDYEDNSLEELVSSFFALSKFETSFFYVQGFKDYKKLNELFLNSKEEI